MAPEDLTTSGTGRPARPPGSLPAAILAVLFALILLPIGASFLFDGDGPVVVDIAIAIALLSAGAGLSLIAIGTFSVRSEPGGLNYARRLVWIGRWVTLLGAIAAIILGIIGDVTTQTPGREPLWPSPVFTACGSGSIGLILGWLTSRRMR
jgi:hypothetical protein